MLASLNNMATLDAVSSIFIFWHLCLTTENIWTYIGKIPNRLYTNLLLLILTVKHSRYILSNRFYIFDNLRLNIDKGFSSIINYAKLLNKLLDMYTCNIQKIIYAIHLFLTFGEKRITLC